MASIDIDFKDLEKFRDKLQEVDMKEAIEESIQTIASIGEAKVKSRTPVGLYEYNLPGYEMTGGSLRRGWHISNIKVEGDNYVIELYNDKEYAPYVEFGHRQEPGRFVPAIGKRLKRGWVRGQFMLTISMDELKDEAPDIICEIINEELKKVKI